MILFLKLIKKYKIRDLGEAETFLGMEIVRDRKKRTLKIKQSKYIENMCERFGLTEAKPVHTPMDHKVVLRKAMNMPELHPDNELYRAIIGSLMYAAQLCRPDSSGILGWVDIFSGRFCMYTLNLSLCHVGLVLLEVVRAERYCGFLCAYWRCTGNRYFVPHCMYISPLTYSTASNSTAGGPMRCSVGGTDPHTSAHTRR